MNNSSCSTHYALEEKVAGEWIPFDSFDSMTGAELARARVEETLAKVGLPPAELRIRTVEETP